MSLLNTSVLNNVNTIVLDKAEIYIDNKKMNLAERILKARIYAKLNQEDLAAKAGCTQDMISKLENGIRKKTSHIVKIARACGVSVDWLDSETGEMLNSSYELTPKLKAHVEVLKTLPDYAVEEVMRDAIKTSELIEKAQADPTRPKRTGATR